MEGALDARRSGTFRFRFRGSAPPGPDLPAPARAAERECGRLYRTHTDATALASPHDVLGWPSSQVESGVSEARGISRRCGT